MDDTCDAASFRPEQPERDGPHWWATPWGQEVIRHWYADPDQWSDGLGTAHSMGGWTYLGRCIPPSEYTDSLPWEPWP